MNNEKISEAAVEATARFLYGNMPDREQTRRALQIALPHLVADRDAEIARLRQELADEQEYSERVDALHGTGKRPVEKSNG